MIKKTPVKRKALSLDKVLVAKVAQLLENIINRRYRGLDLAPAHRLAAHLDKLAGDKPEHFLQVREPVRKELHRAAGFIARKHRKAESLRDFILRVAEILKMSARRIAAFGKSIVLFLLALVDRERARIMRPTYMPG